MRKIFHLIIVLLISSMLSVFANSIDDEMEQYKLRSIFAYKMFSKCEKANNFDGIKTIGKVDDKCHFTKNILTIDTITVYDCYSPLDVMEKYSLAQIKKLKNGKAVDDIKDDKTMNKYCKTVIKKGFKVGY